MIALMNSSSSELVAMTEPTETCVACSARRDGLFLVTYGRKPFSSALSFEALKTGARFYVVKGRAPGGGDLASISRGTHARA